MTIQYCNWLDKIACKVRGAYKIKGISKGNDTKNIFNNKAQYT